MTTARCPVCKHQVEVYPIGHTLPVRAIISAHRVPPSWMPCEGSAWEVVVEGKARA